MESVLKGFTRFAALAALSALAAGCSSGGSAVEPTVTQANLSANKLQFAVGVANVNGTAMLNTVVAYRSPSGGAATLLNTPSITGPAGFVVNAASSGGDRGTNHISGSPQPLAGTAAAPSSFGTSGGAFEYGFAPINATTGGSPSYGIYGQPFYTPGLKYVGGPPAYPNVRDGSYPSGFVGFNQGFVAFDQVTLVAGAYQVSVTVPASNASGITQTATATLTSLAPLPAVAAPVFTRAGANGGSVTFTVPANATEAIAYVYDSTARAYYSQVVHGSGAQSVTIQDNLGPHAYGAAAAPTFATGDKLSVYVAAFDYPAYEAGPPANTSQTPALAGASGQADVSLSAAAAFTY